MLISKAAGKSCQLDPIPTPIVLKLLDVLLPVITKLINLSFDTGRFAEAWKEALVLLSLKKPSLDFALKNFRPVSNLSYVSKLSERAGVEQFMEHLTANIYIFSFNRRINSTTTRRRPYLKLRMIF